jgi:hypothetical protein
MLSPEQIRTLAMALKRLGYIDVESSSPDEWWDGAVEQFLAAIADLGWTLGTDGDDRG